MFSVFWNQTIIYLATFNNVKRILGHSETLLKIYSEFNFAKIEKFAKSYIMVKTETVPVKPVRVDEKINKVTKTNNF